MDGKPTFPRDRVRFRLGYRLPTLTFLLEVRPWDFRAWLKGPQIASYRPGFFEAQCATELGHDGAAAFEDDARQLAIDQFLDELDWGWGECLLAPLKIEGERDHA